MKGTLAPGNRTMSLMGRAGRVMVFGRGSVMGPALLVFFCDPPAFLSASAFDFFLGCFGAMVKSTGAT
jgi:hypothetical protein